MRLIKLNKENIVIQVRNNANLILKDEIESYLGDIGQKMIDINNFIDMPIVEGYEMLIEDKILMETQYQTILMEMYFV